MPPSHDSDQVDLLDEQASIGRTATDSYESTIFNLATPDLPQADRPLYAKSALYTSHFLSTWGQRMWEFAIGLIMLELYPSSLALVSTFGLVDGGVQIVSGAWLGSYVDRSVNCSSPVIHLYQFG